MSQPQKMQTEIHNAVNGKIGMSRYVERPGSVCFADHPPASSYKPVYGQLPDRRHSTKFVHACIALERFLNTEAVLRCAARRRLIAGLLYLQHMFDLSFRIDSITNRNYYG